MCMCVDAHVHVCCVCVCVCVGGGGGVGVWVGGGRSICVHVCVWQVCPLTLVLEEVYDGCSDG